MEHWLGRVEEKYGKVVMYLAAFLMVFLYLPFVVLGAIFGGNHKKPKNKKPTAL